MSGTRFNPAKAEALSSQLSDRDRAIVREIARVRALSGSQLTRLHFHDLSPATRDRTRRLVMNRLTALDLTATLNRRIGGARAGSAGLVLSLGLAGQHVAPLLANDHADSSSRARRPWTPGRLFLTHTLDVAELYVRLREAERHQHVTLAAFTTEPASWHPTSQGGHLKPDAYVIVYRGSIEDHLWVEIDRATESLPTLRRKLLGYVDFVRTGQIGPNDMIPRVLVTVPHQARHMAVEQLIADLPAPASQLISTTLFETAIESILTSLHP